jgi:hypothetical protein
MRITAADESIPQNHDAAVTARDTIQHLDMDRVEPVLHELVQCCGRKAIGMALIVHTKTHNRTKSEDNRAT